MLKITKNTYPKDGVGKHKAGTLCKWRTERGHLLLSVVDNNGDFLRNGLMYENIFSHGQIYAINGNLLSGKKEPNKIGIVAKFVKNGFFLEVAKHNITNKDIHENHRICLIKGCNHYVAPMNEVDVGVGIISSNEPPICEDCYLSENPEIQAQIKAIEKDNENPFGNPF